MERRTTGLNLETVKGGGRKEKPQLRSWACWRGALAGGAQGTESPRWPRVLALSGRFPWRKRSKVSRAALQGRRAQLRHADGLRGCLPAPGAPNSCREDIQGLHVPATDLLLPNCSSRLFVKDLVVTETLGPCLILGIACKS